MEVFEAIKKRRSTRRFDASKQVSDEQIEKILEAGRLAPSAHNLQDWFFIVVKAQDKKDKLVEAAAGQSFVGEASIVIVVCADLRLADRHSTRHGEDFYMIQDTAIATIQMWLAATSLGLGAFNRDVPFLQIDVLPVQTVNFRSATSRKRTDGRKG